MLKERTAFVHHRQCRHPPVHKYGEGFIERRRLLNSGNVPERSDPKLPDLPSDERRLGNFLPLKTIQTPQ